MLDAKKRAEALKSLAALWAKVSEAEAALAKAITAAEAGEVAFKRNDNPGVPTNAKKE